MKRNFIDYSGANGDSVVAQSRAPDEAQQLDVTDLKILARIQQDARISNIDLSKRVGLTAPPVLRRVRKLERMGAIKGYHAQLDPSKLGFAVSAVVCVGLKSQNGTDVKAFEDSVQGWRNVREMYVVQGEFDFLLKCVARDLPEFQDFVTTRLMILPNIRNVRSALIIQSELKPAFPLS